MKKNTIRTITKIFAGLLTALMIMAFVPAVSDIFTVTAQAIDVSGRLYTIDSDSQAHVSMDVSSEVKHEFKAGESMFVTNITDGWYEVYYQGELLYVRDNAISDEAMASNEQSFEEQVEALDKEFDEMEKADKTYIDSLQQQRIRERNSLIWKISIAVLIVLILGVSIFIGISNNKKAAKDSKDSSTEKDNNV